MATLPAISSSEETVTRPYIAAVIPSLRGDVGCLVQSLQAQTWPPDEIQVVRGVRPNGKARNTGVANLEGPKSGANDCLLLFIDDDALPGQLDLIEKMVKPLLQAGGAGPNNTGVSGSARILPQNTAWFERRVAVEIPRMANEVPSQPLVTNPPLVGYGHSLITTTCCAVWKSTYQRAGGFSNELTSGVDTDFFYRVRQFGYQFVMPPDIYVLHHAPKNLAELWKKFYWYGQGYAQETQRRPEQHMGFRLKNPVLRAAFLLAATIWLLPNVFILYSFSYPKFAVGFRPLKAFSTYAVAWGYVAGWRADRS